jgi:potassium efflux system protein
MGMLPPAVFGTPPPQDTARELVGDLEQTLEASLNAEQNTLKAYEERLERTGRERIYLAAAANGFQLQLSTFSNLLLSAGVDLSVLQRTRADLKSSLMEIQKMTESLAPGAEAISSEKINLEQQKDLIRRQISELSGLTAKNRNGTAKKLEKTARKLQGVLQEKENLISKLDTIYQGRLTDLKNLETAFSDLAIRYDTAIEQYRAKNLFERQEQVFRFDALRALKDETTLLARKTLTLFSPDAWREGLKSLWQSAGLSALSILVVLYGVVSLMIRIRSTLLRGHAIDAAEKRGPWNRTALLLAGYSAIPGGIAATLFIYSRMDTMYIIAPLLNAGTIILLILLGVRWAGTAFSGPAAVLSGEKIPAGKLVRLSRGIGLFCLVYLPVYAVLGAESALLVALRLAGALWLLVWALVTWRQTRLSMLQKIQKNTRPELVKLGCKALLTLISAVALVLDMTGYASLSFHWLLSWIQTAAIAFWWWVMLAVLREWDTFYREKSNSVRNDLLYDDYPVQWLLIRAGQFVWLITLAALLLLAWGNQQTVLDRAYKFLAHPMTVGNMKFSLMGLVYAVVVILMTYALTRIWKWLFQTKFLSRSGMEIGLQDSITTITVYVIWAFGILVSLHVFGLNTASLAVAFGALGIGLGFGLQNIFNNFVSGIILLFERPIQVGDDIEINGIWAQVKKINFRSTVIQSYDNASLIVPNADFISSQVTNWSFKDKRIRRNITVGVAYGSDTELVRKSLLEIADGTARVLKFPKPDVLFRDFGDSALIFRLRVWTDIDNMLKVETAIRFDIDRIFRERSIEISFPQRDIHIRTAAGLGSLSAMASGPVSAAPDNPAEKPAD